MFLRGAIFFVGAIMATSYIAMGKEHQAAFWKGKLW